MIREYISYYKGGLRKQLEKVPCGQLVFGRNNDNVHKHDFLMREVTVSLTSSMEIFNGN